MPAEHVLTPDDKCPCGKPQTGSGYCSYECYSKHEPEPASMGGPLSEAERLAEIRRSLKMAKMASANAPGTFWHTFTENAEFLLELVGVLEGQLATARALHKPERRYTPDDGETSYATYAEAADASFAGFGTPVSVTFFEVCSHCASIEMAEGCDHQYKESLWPCEDAVALGLDGGDPDGS